MQELTNTVTINGKEVKKTALRRALSDWKFFYDKLQSEDNELPLKEIFKFSEISEVKQSAQPTWFITDGRCNFCVVRKNTEIFNGYELLKDFVLSLKDEECTAVTINYDEAIVLLGDKDIDAQKEFLRNLDITPLNEYISKLLGIQIEFQKEITGNYRDDRPELTLYTEELVQHSGIMQVNLESLVCHTFGFVHFYFDVKGNQQVAFPDIHFSYQHKGGGSNGTDVASIIYDMHTNKWFGRAVGTDEMIALN